MKSPKKQPKIEASLPATAEVIVPQLRTTRDLRMILLATFEDLVAKRITPHEARSRALLARAILDTVKTELVRERANLESYKTIDLTVGQEIAGEQKSPELEAPTENTRPN